MNIQVIDIEKLKAADYNPRIDLQKGDEEYEKIKRSIKEFGYVDPVIVNSDMTVIGGHQRLKVLKDLGYKKIECAVVELSKEKEKALNIALNKISGKWDYDKLSDLLNELVDNVDIDETLTGFSKSEIEDMGTDFINDLLDEDYATANRTLNQFAITFNIDKEYQEMFSKYIKENGKEKLIEIMIEKIKEEL